ncbi:MAG: energy transducer TonB, partial [Bacteroidales bacterium]|nr:energy transducer TonB [Bacteroidales bacterium]
NAGEAGETGTSEGVAGGEGNQGVETGTVGAPNYGPGGGIGDGTISFSLGDRNYRSIPKPLYDYQKEGKVVVEISVNRAGVVTDAFPGVKGSTTADTDLWREAKKAALKATFESNNNAPLLQKGTITYIFKLK